MSVLTNKGSEFDPRMNRYFVFSSSCFDLLVFPLLPLLTFKPELGQIILHTRINRPDVNPVFRRILE